MALNRYECIGRIGSLKMSYLQSGTAVMELSVAVDESYRDKEGNKVEKCEWVRVKAFDKQADFCDKWLRKGARVYVAGKLATRTWEKDGQKHYQTEVMVNAPGMGVTPIDWPDKADQPQDRQPARGKQARGNDGASGRNNYGEKPQDEDLGPAFPSEASGMDDVPF